MCDWMLGVLACFKPITTNRTYFLSVAIMDLYFKKFRAAYPDKDLYNPTDLNPFLIL